jgi:hypothetical protein
MKRHPGANRLNEKLVRKIRQDARAALAADRARYREWSFLRRLSFAWRVLWGR